MVQVLEIEPQKDQKGNKKSGKSCYSWKNSFKSTLRGKYLFICLLVVMLSILVLTLLILYFTTFSTEKQMEPVIISRHNWMAKPPKGPTEPLTTPVPYVVILHTVSNNCLTQNECSSLARQIQNTHTNENKFYNDIAYSFLVGGDGNVYEGRGWDTKGAFGYSYNRISIGIAFIGSFSSVVPNEKQIQAGLQLIDLGVNQGKISHDYKLLAHRQISATESPGEAFYEVIKTWPHWQNIQTNGSQPV